VQSIPDFLYKLFENLLTSEIRNTTAPTRIGQGGPARSAWTDFSRGMLRCCSKGISYFFQEKSINFQNREKISFSSTDSNLIRA